MLLDRTTIAACEEEGIRAYVDAGLDPERPVSIAKLCKGLGWRAPRAERMAKEGFSGVLEGEVIIRFRAGLPPPRASFVCAHEAGHRRMGHHHGGIAIVEATTDLLAACLLVPRPAFEQLVKRHGHAVYDLAHGLGITQAAAMLRLGEVTGRPVYLLGPRPRARGDAFDWTTIDLDAARRGHMRKVAHPIFLRDEGKWGLMATG